MLFRSVGGNSVPPPSPDAAPADNNPFGAPIPEGPLPFCVIILCLVLILVFRAISGTVLALVLHAVLALVGTIIRAVLGCIFGAVFLGTVIIVAVTVFA